MFENILKAELEICEYSRNNRQSYDDDFFNQLERRFRFCWFSYQSSCLFYFCSLKFHCVKETHMMLVAFWRW